MGTAVAQGVAWLIKWFILRPLFYILIQVLWPFIYGLGVNSWLSMRRGGTAAIGLREAC